MDSLINLYIDAINQFEDELLENLTADSTAFEPLFDDHLELH